MEPPTKEKKRAEELVVMIREDLGNSYTVTYYPQQNPNEGFRKIGIEIPISTRPTMAIRTQSGRVS